MPTGVLGFLLAGLAAAFMSNFAATLNAAPAYVVNDIYKRFINPNAGGKKEVALSRIVSLRVSRHRHRSSACSPTASRT